MDQVPVEAFLEPFPPRMRQIAGRLRRVIGDAVPEAIERVRPGWRLIGYDLPIGAREGARVARMTRGERIARLLDRDEP